MNDEHDEVTEEDMKKFLDGIAKLRVALDQQQADGGCGDGGCGGCGDH